MTKNALRPYQQKAIDDTRKALRKHKSVVLQMPTGAGKTRAATELLATMRGRIWFLCHRREIVRQTVRAFKKAGLDFGVIAPGFEAEYGKRIQVASIQTIMNHVDELDAPAVVIWDECHHVAAASWAKLRERLDDSKHIGLTATPERLDGKGLAEWFKALVCGPTLRELIDERYLSPFRYFAPSEPDLAKAKVGAKGDYTHASAEAAMNMPVLIGDAIKEYRRHIDGKRALVFAVSVEASKELVRRFKRAGVAAAHVDGKTSVDERDRAVADLEAGRIKVLSNVEVFTEGFDVPAIDAVILMRPTRSLALYLQMVGRALRKMRGKKEAYLFDHAGLWLDHGRPDADWHWTLDGNARAGRLEAVRASGERMRRCPECKEVRFERAPVCECGYEFPSGREVGVHDGRLRELEGGVPEGCLSTRQFARRHKRSLPAVHLWIKKGLPHMWYSMGRLVPIESGDVWVSQNIGHYISPSSAPVGCATSEAFAKRYAVSGSTVKKWRDGGMPTKDGYVCVAEADAWVSKHFDLASHDCFRKGVIPDGFETRRQLAKRLGVSRGVVDFWVRGGLPLKGRVVNSKRANEWIRKNIDLGRTKRVSNSLRGIRQPGYITVEDCNTAYGLSSTTVRGWIRSGLPATEYGVHKEGMMSWLRTRNSTQVAPIWEGPRESYELPVDFARRINGKQKRVLSWRAAGLPHSSNGWIHIQKGLEWIRDNTDIKIPKSAWPKPVANDNATTKQRRAA